MTHTHVSRAADHLAAVDAARLHLQDLHADAEKFGHTDKRGKAIAAQYDAIRTGSRLAEAHAQIAQAEALERIARAVEGFPGVEL